MKSYTMNDGVTYAGCTEEEDGIDTIEAAENFARGFWSVAEPGTYEITIKEIEGYGVITGVRRTITVTVEE